MTRRLRRGRSERDEELEEMREEMREEMQGEMREVRRELMETLQMMRAQGSGRSRGTQAQDDSDHSSRRPPPTRENMSQMEAMKRFMVMQPPFFFAKELDIKLAENWLRCIKRIFDGLDIPEERRVGLAAYMLVDRVDFWWEIMK